MTVKDFLNFKKPHFWVALISVAVIAFAGVVSVLDKEEPAEQVEVPPEEEIEVEEEELPEQSEEPVKTESQIILERFQSIDWEEVKKNAKAFGEEGWEQGVVVLAENSYAGITLYGYNDAEYQYRGVAVEHNGNINYFDWQYTSAQHIQPQMYWDGSERQLQITLNISEASEINVEELHVLVEHDTMTMEDFVFRSSDYLMEIEEQMNGTGMSVGSYVDIKLGEPMMLQFMPVKTADGKEEAMKLHQAVIHLNSSKDGFVFELGDIGVEPEKRTATIEIEGIEESYTEIQYISEQGYTLWYPEDFLAAAINGHEGFTNLTASNEKSSEVIIVPEGDMDLDDSYLKEAAGNFKDSGEYEKVTVSKVKSLTADDKNVKIRMIEVVHDDTADRFYIVKGKDQALLITASMLTEGLEGWGERINAMIQTITFTETAE